MSNGLAKIHAQKNGDDAILNKLAALPFNSLTPILVDTMLTKSKQITPLALINEADSKQDFFGVSSISQKEFNNFHHLFFDVMPEKFESIQLSPIAPLGMCTALTKLGQNERLTTIRKSEVISDSTLALAVQAAIRRKHQGDGPECVSSEVHLSTFHRLLRLQRFDPEKHWSQHFEILGLLSTGRRKGKNSFRNETIKAHVQLWIDFFRHLNTKDYQFNNVEISFCSIPLIEWILKRYGIDRASLTKNSLRSSYDYFQTYSIPIPRRLISIEEIRQELSLEEADKNLLQQFFRFEAEVLEPLKEKNPDICFSYELNRKLGLGYYNGFCFHGFATNANGEIFDLIDGGASNWVGQMLSDSREITVTSSFGVEVGIAQFHKK